MLFCAVGFVFVTMVSSHEHWSGSDKNVLSHEHPTKWGPWPDVAADSHKRSLLRENFSDVDLSGIWSSPVAPTHRYLFFRSGGGYGTGKDKHAAFPHMPVHEPGTAYDVKCLTSDFRGGKPGGCGWDKAVCTLTAGTDGKSPIATCAFDNGATLPGAVSADGCSINMSAPWTKFCGELSGLWSGPKENSDYYVLTHDKATNDVTVWWDTAITASLWTWGNGTFDPKSKNISFVLANYQDNPCGGTVDATMSKITSGCLVGWHKQATQMLPSEIHTVHLVFMNHLDVGYASFINNIDNEYFHGYFPKAKLLADQMRALEGTDRFIYVTHPWLMSFFLDCPCVDSNDPNCSALTLNNPYAPPLQCPSAEEIHNLTVALKNGDIVWHAAPFNVQAENMGGALFEAGIKQFQAFDKEFYGENRTITMSDRDVIYVTRSVIPLLAKYGIKGLTIGSNGANYPPQVPKLHVWRDPVSGEEVIVAYHPYGYGGYSKSTCAGPGQCGDCAEAPNGVALCTEFRTDNSGPPANTDEVLASLDAVRAEYPRASVFASTFDNFIRDVLPIKDQLPVVTKEVGDTWMYGAPSDPLKMAQNREIQRAWEECLATGDETCDYSNAAIQNMTRFLMKAPEHTWGIPGISGWGGGDSYERSKFLTLRNSTGFLHAAATWAEQRVYNELAIKALEHAQHPLANSVRARVDALSNVVQPDLSAYTKEPTLATVVTVAGVAIGFDGVHGEIVQLTDTRGGRKVGGSGVRVLCGWRGCFLWEESYSNVCRACMLWDESSVLVIFFPSDAIEVNATRIDILRLWPIVTQCPSPSHWPHNRWIGLHRRVRLVDLRTTHSTSRIGSHSHTTTSTGTLNLVDFASRAATTIRRACGSAQL
eukprot:m.79354 g.79354  ORF g.79354 m.79354 type:complete len:876 (+) comp16268_c0_seq5:68-2695(+)